MTIAFDAAQLREIANSKGDKTLEQIAETTGVDIGLLSRVFTGQRQPRFATAVKLAHAYGINMPLAKRVQEPAESAA